MAGSRRKKEKIKKPFWRRAGLIILIIVLALVVFFTAFHTENVVVSGNTRYSEADIKSICLDGALSENTVLFTLFNRRIDLSDMPFMDHVDSSMIDRNTIHLSVNERISAGRIEFGGKICYFDRNGRVLDIREKNEEQDLTAVLIEGPVPEAETINEGDVIFAENEKLLSEVSVLSQLLLSYGLVPDRVLIDEENNMTLIFGNIQINLGDDSFLEEKTARADAIYADIKDGSGILHLEDYSETSKDIIFEEKDPS